MTVDWRQRAACKDVDPDLFFQETGRPSDRLKAICAGCKVLIPCWFDAIRRGDSGYQAGMSKAEREQIRRWDRRQRRLPVRGRLRKVAS
ncbi:WhiB family transcriptional regulator [Nonomuraea sp. NPDC003804]|uniref:WhiB family transcriptional regulator n=1 Tax=Nonomuraea sp. NPDC003804 TaxID=3154547 RepID=UPI0033A0821A